MSVYCKACDAAPHLSRDSPLGLERMRMYAKTSSMTSMMRFWPVANEALFKSNIGSAGPVHRSMPLSRALHLTF